MTKSLNPAVAYELAMLGLTLYSASRYWDTNGNCFEPGPVGQLAATVIAAETNRFTAITGFHYEVEGDGDGYRLWDETRGEYFWPSSRDVSEQWYNEIGLATYNGALGTLAEVTKLKAGE